MAQMKKPVAKKSTDPSKTKPFNVKLIKPSEIIKDKPKAKTTKAPVKKKVLVMPNKISPSKMTPAQKARYLKNPERYDG
jgi:hypothetical protein